MKMNATPKRLVTLGLGLMALAFFIGFLTALLGGIDANETTSGRAATLVSQLCFVVGILSCLGGALAWVVKVGVRAARED